MPAAYYEPAIAAQLTALESYVDPVMGAAAAMRAIDPGLAPEKYIFPAPELLRTAHYFKLLTPAENASYTVRYQSAVGCEPWRRGWPRLARWGIVTS